MKLSHNHLLLQITNPGTEAANGGFLSGLSSMEALLLGLMTIVFLAGMGSIIQLSFTLMKMQQIRLMEKYHPEVLQKIGLPLPAAVTAPWWQKVYEKLNDRVPMDKENDILLDHDYDGVHELDNNLPPWWKGVFYIAIAFAPLYIWFNHYSDYGKSSAEAYAIEMEMAEEEVKAYVATQKNAVDESNVAVLAEAEDLDRGRMVFNSKCAVCHGQQGEGGIGPNLTDVYWIHGGSIKDVFKTIKYGVPEKGMIAWKNDLNARSMQEIASYIISLKGTDPPGAKEPQGEEYKEGNLSR